MHTSVFLEEAVEQLSVQKRKRYIDATYGEGGHSHLIMQKGGLVLGIDADLKQVEKAQDVTVVHGNFANIADIARDASWIPVSGVLFDFGLSMTQLQTHGRGLSYRSEDEILDMRLFPSEENLAAYEYLQTASENILRKELGAYSEDPLTDKIVKEIINTRGKEKLKTVSSFLKLIQNALGPHSGRESKDRCYARFFQALRIIVNKEPDSIMNGLKGAFEILEPKGRIVAITFHSIEDRYVKLFARSLGAQATSDTIAVERVRKLATFERSATLRVIQKL